jgi:hypothetical protein
MRLTRFVVTASAMAMLGLGALPVAAHAQRVSDTRTAVTRAQPDSVVLHYDSVPRPAVRRSGQRVLTGFGVGVGLGLAGLKANVCFDAQCSWDFLYGGLAGYWLGGIVGTAVVPGERCSFSRRLGRAALGALPGTAVSLLVAGASEGVKNGGAVLATVIVGFAPIVSSTIALRSCDPSAAVRASHRTRSDSRARETP